MLSVHRKQTYNRNYHYTCLFHSLSSHSAISQYCHSIETARNSSPLHLRISTLFLLARHRIHYHVHTIINALHSLRDDATLKNEVAIYDAIPFYVTRRTDHLLPTRGYNRKLQSAFIPCSRYYHSIWTIPLRSFQYSSNSNNQYHLDSYSETMQSSSSDDYSIIQTVREQFRLRRDNDT